LASFRNDVDMLGTSLFGYAKNIVSEVISVGRAGTLIDWEGEVEKPGLSDNVCGGDRSQLAGGTGQRAECSDVGRVA